LLAQEIARLAGQVLSEYAAVSKKLTQAKSFGAPYVDMVAQLNALIGKRFVIDTPYTQLSHFPRYLNAMALRIDKLKADAVRDARLSAEIAPLLQNYQRAIAQRGGVADAAIERIQMAAGGTAGVAVCARTSHADADFGQAFVQGVGIDAALRQVKEREARLIGSSRFPASLRVSTTITLPLRPKAG
jgi:hypothetical protein